MSTDPFVREAREDVRKLSDGIVELERSGGDRETVDDLFRTAHSLKGTFGMEGHERASEVAHAIEDFLDAVRGGRLDPEGEVVDRALDAADELDAMLDDIGRGETPDEGTTAVAERLRETVEAASDDVDDESESEEPTDGQPIEIEDPTAETDPDMSAEEALEAASEFDDLEALMDQIDEEQAEEFDDLEGGGAFDETVEAEVAVEPEPEPEPESEPGAEAEADADGEDEFDQVKAEVDEDQSMAELQSEIEDVSFGEFDEEDEMSIQELVELEPDEEEPEVETEPVEADTPIADEPIEEEGDAEGEPEAEAEVEEVAEEPSAEADVEAEEPEPAEADIEAEEPEPEPEPEPEAEPAEADIAEEPEPEPEPAEADIAEEMDEIAEVEFEPAEPEEPEEAETGELFDDEDIDLEDVEVEMSESADVETTEFARDEQVEEFAERFEGIFEPEEGEEATPTVAASTLEGTTLDTDDLRRPDRSERRIVPERRIGEVQALTIDVKQADELLSVAEDLSTRIRRLSEQVEDLDPSLLNSLESATRDLRRTVMEVRLMPLETVTDRLDRVVRDVARSAGVEAELVVDGQDVRLDRSIIERLGDPVVHLVRNAVDHGIEPPADREAAGKPRTGTVEIRAERTGDTVDLVIEDDGRGIDVDAVREKAVEEGLVEADEADALPDSEVYDFLFHPGFSTQEEVTETSGRGVGMDVVRETVEALNGTIEVESTPGKGTLVRLTLPVTVAVAEVIFVRVGDERFAVPTANVESVGPSRDETVAAGGLFGADPSRTIDLADVLMVERDEDGVSAEIHVNRTDGLVALRCDEILERREVVINPYDDLLADITTVNGSTMAEDGTLINVVDVEGI